MTEGQGLVVWLLTLFLCFALWCLYFCAQDRDVTYPRLFSWPEMAGGCKGAQGAKPVALSVQSLTL